MVSLYYSDAFRDVRDYVGERQDEGIDASGNGPVYPYGRCRIKHIVWNWYAGKPLVIYELLRGPRKGFLVYLAECVTWDPRALIVGQVFTRYQHLGYMSTLCGTGVEFGWADPDGRGPLRHWEYQEGWRMAGAASFDRWCARHGWRRSRPTTAQVHGTLPAGYP